MRFKIMKVWYFQKQIVLIKRREIRIFVWDVCMINCFEFWRLFKVKTTLFVIGHFFSFENLNTCWLSTQIFTKDKENLFAFNLLSYLFIMLSLFGKGICDWGLDSNFFVINLALHCSFILAKNRMNFGFVIGIRRYCDSGSHLLLC